MVKMLHEHDNFGEILQGIGLSAPLATASLMGLKVAVQRQLSWQMQLKCVMSFPKSDQAAVAA